MPWWGGIASDEFGGVTVLDPSDPSATQPTIETGLEFIEWIDASADGAVALVGNQYDAVLVDLDGGAVLRRMEFPLTEVSWGRAASLRSAGDLLAVLTAEGVEIQEAESGRVVARPGLGGGAPSSLTFTPDGGSLAIGTTAGTVSFHGSGDGEPTGTVLRGQRAQVTQVAIAPDGTVLVAAVDDTIRLFDSGGAVLGDSLGIAPSTDVAATLDAAAMMVSAKGAVVVDLDVDGWPAVASTWAGRELTEAERRQFRIDG